MECIFQSKLKIQSKVKRKSKKAKVKVKVKLKKRNQFKKKKFGFHLRRRIEGECSTAATEMTNREEDVIAETKGNREGKDKRIEEKTDRIRKEEVNHQTVHLHPNQAQAKTHPPETIQSLILVSNQILVLNHL